MRNSILCMVLSWRSRKADTNTQETRENIGGNRHAPGSGNIRPISCPSATDALTWQASIISKSCRLSRNEPETEKCASIYCRDEKNHPPGLPHDPIPRGGFVLYSPVVDRSHKF